MANSEFTCSDTAVHEDAVKYVNSVIPPEEITARAAVFFKVLGDPTRLRIIWAISCREMCVCDIAAVLGMTKSAVSHQLSKLRSANLVSCRREGKSVFYSLADEHVEGMLKSGMEHVHEYHPRHD